MDNINLYNVDQGSEAWFELRCGRFTASKFKDVMAGKSTAGYTGIVNTIVGEIISQTTEPTYTNDIMQRGIDLEGTAAELYEELYGLVTKEIGFVTNEANNPEYIGVSPDRMLPDNGILEIKCPLMKTHVGYLSANKLPTVYKWQVQGQLMITEADYCDFMSFYPGIRPFILRVEPDKEIQEALRLRIEESIEIIKETVNFINNG